MISPPRVSTITNCSLLAVRRLVSAAGEYGLVQTRPSPRRRRRPACARRSAASRPCSPKYASSFGVMGRS